MVTCTNCGHENPENSRFCSQCGSPLAATAAAETADRIPTGDTTRTLAPLPESETEGLSAEDEAAVNALPRGSALLIVQRGPNAGGRFLLNTEIVTAGRHQRSDIFLDDISVSRRHATFTRTAEGTVLKDAGSLNGTYVNREIVEEALLRHGDEVQLGKFRFIYFASAQGVD